MFNEKIRNPLNRAVAVVCLGGLGIWIGCGSQAVAQDSQNRAITKVFTEPVEKSIAASAETGVIVDARVKEGDRVEVGDVLAKINHAVLLASLKIAKARASSTARYDAAASQVKLIKSQLEAVRSLIEDGHTNKYEVEQKESEYQTAFAEFRAAEDELALNKLEVGRIEAQIEDRFIRSPIDGFVTEIHKQPGENVSNNEPMYATIVKVEQLRVRFYLNSETLTNSQVGEQVSIELGSRRIRTPATVVYVSPIINPDSGLGRLDVVVDNHDFKIKSGTICNWHGKQSTRSYAGNQSSIGKTGQSNLAPTLKKR